MIRIDRDPPLRQLRVFALLWLVFFSVLGWIVWRKSGSAAAAGAICAAAVLVPAIGLAYRPFLRRVYVGMAYAAFPIGWVISHLLLAVVYYLVLTPIGLGLRLAGHDPMARQPRRDDPAGTYWREHDPGEGDVKRYFRQF